MTRSRVLGTGSYAPEKVLTNQDLERMVETSDEWIVERTGIRERRIAVNMASSDLAYEAAKKALKVAGLKGSQLDLIVVATVTPDMMFPATACILQARLGARKAAAFDISAACSGFIFALAAADNFIKAGPYKNALVVGAETLSTITDWTDRNTCILFGDGAGALVIGESDGSDRGVCSTHLHTDGKLGDLLSMPGGGSRNPSSVKSVESGMHFIKMRGNETFKLAVRALEEVVNEALTFNGLGMSDIDIFVPHQANLRIIQATAKRLGIPMEKVVVTIDKFGNTSAASVPMALDEAVMDGRIGPGKNVLLEAFGGGLSWASALIKW